MFKTRLITALIGIPILLFLLYEGGLYWKIFFSGIAFLAFYEFVRMMSNKQYKPLFIPGIILILLLLFNATFYIMIGIFSILVVTVCIIILKYPHYNIADLSITLLGAFYIGFLMSYAIAIEALPHAFLIILLTLVLTWASDTGAYVVGKLWGSHKMAPALSPKKTWEGTAGGLILSAITAIVFFMIADMDTVSFAYALLLGIMASILAQFGDLFISWMKRYFEVKDTGKILPGHGGVLDRFDSFLLVVPLIYYFAVYIIK